MLLSILLVVLLAGSAGSEVSGKPVPQNVLSLLQERYVDHVEDLRDFVAIPSVSALPDHADDVRRAAGWLAERLTTAGLHNVTILETQGPRPVVYADWSLPQNDKDSSGEAERLMVLVYAHYDVQPVDPVEEWNSPPFSLSQRDGWLYGRGVDDDKGGLLMALHAVEALLQITGSLPVDVKFLFEGEEELMSPNLHHFLSSHKELLSADLVLSADGGQISEEQGGVGLGLRGVMGAEVVVKTADSDMHSGMAGGSVANANVVLAKLLSQLHDDETARVRVPGFYDGVKEPSAEERADVAAMELDEEAEQRALGVVGELHGEAGYSTLERRWYRPTLEVVGMHGGFTGEGLKTVIPRQASAKLSCRLVAGQKPEDILAKIQAYILSMAPKYAEVAVTSMGGSSEAYSVDRRLPGNRAAATVIQQVFGKPAKFYRRGATIPALAAFGPILDIPVTAFGWGLGDHIHAPNERLLEIMYKRGHEAWVRVLWELGTQYSKGDFMDDSKFKASGSDKKLVESGQLPKEEL